MICVLLWLGLWSCSFIAAPVQLRMAAAAQERGFVQLSAHRCPGALHQWRLPHGSRDCRALQEEIWSSSGSSCSAWVWIIITERWRSYYTNFVLSILCCFLFFAEKKPGECAVLRTSGRFVYYLVRWPVVFRSLYSTSQALFLLTKTCLFQLFSCTRSPRKSTTKNPPMTFSGWASCQWGTTVWPMALTVYPCLGKLTRL